MPYKSKDKQKEYQAQWHQDNKDRRRAKAGVRYAAKRSHIQQLKESSPCTDCQEFYPYYVMQYDHIHSKFMGINEMIAMNYSLEVILKEIEMCELVCANCHAARTHRRYYEMLEESG